MVFHYQTLTIGSRDESAVSLKMSPSPRFANAFLPTDTALEKRQARCNNDEGTLHSISTSADLKAFNECNYKTLNGSIRITGNKLPKTGSIPDLEKVLGQIEILTSSTLESIIFPDLIEIQKNLTLDAVEGFEAPKLISVDGLKLSGYRTAPKFRLPALRTLEKLSIENVSLGSEDRLSDQFKELEELKGLDISASSKIPSLEFPSLKQLGSLVKQHTLSISGDSTVGSLLFPSLRKINGTVNLEPSCFDCKALADYLNHLGLDTSSLNDFSCSSPDKGITPTCRIAFGKDAISASTSKSPPPQDGNTKVGFIGGVVGGILLLFIGLFLLWRRRQKLRRRYTMELGKMGSGTGTTYSGKTSNSGKSTTTGSKTTATATSSSETTAGLWNNYFDSQSGVAEERIKMGHDTIESRITAAGSGSGDQGGAGPASESSAAAAARIQRPQETYASQYANRNEGPPRV